MNKAFDERWTVEAYNDEGNIIQARHAREFSAAVEIAKEMEESTPAWTSSRRKVRYFHDGSGGDRMKSRPMSNGMTESEKDARSDVKPKSPLPWMSSLGDIVGADKVPVVVEISAQNADQSWLVEARSAVPSTTGRMVD
jgi:hypothetical protein